MVPEDSIEEVIYERNYYRITLVTCLRILDNFYKLEPALTKRQDAKLSELRKNLQDATL